MKNFTTIPDAYDVLAADRAAVLSSMAVPMEQYPMPTVTEVVRTYTMEPYEWRTFQSGGYAPLAESIVVTHPADPTSRFVVMHDLLSGEWTVQCPSKRSHHGVVIIDAVIRSKEMAN
ncbi:MAG: hypothetical protein ABIY70_09030 [Capsulimonas sp.]|uniref:hypothetical protein n=1 Tax=Capsulimonas sp. TaxID=2494211 RepID=UPI0032649C88